jgi:cytochrome P450
MIGNLTGGGAPRMLLFTLSELNPEMRRDPHKLLDGQRAHAPVERDATMPILLTASYGLGRDILTDPKLSRNFEHASPENFVIAGVRRLNQAIEAEFGHHDSMLVLEEPDHARVRGTIAKAFLARAQRSRPLIEDAVERALRALDGRDQFDVVGDYACRIPLHVLGPVLGCAGADLDQLRVWTEAGQQAFDPTMSQDGAARAIEGRRGILSYFQNLMQMRREARQDDLVSDLLTAQEQGAKLSDNEILHNMFALLVAGHLTTADLIGNAVLLLLQHPDVRAAIEADPSLIAPAVDEALRFEPPISMTARFPVTSGEIGGCPYHKGDALTVNLLAANRDPAVFDNPHQFDITRRPNPHLAFGAGSHMCVGAPLARLEGQIAILGLLERFPNLRRADDGAAEWRAVAGVRGLARLDVLT